MSNTIHLPGLVKVDDHSATSASFVIEPLHSGYGMTLGNSLRRVLLSSISGAAPVRVARSAAASSTRTGRCGKFAAHVTRATEQPWIGGILPDHAVVIWCLPVRLQRC